jgi:hypothetical protein
MIEALWSVEFVANTQGFGTGVVVVENGKVLGGDAQYFYVGHCGFENGVLQAHVEITHYAGESNSIFGAADKFHIEVSGKTAKEKFTLHGHVIGHPELKISMNFTRRAELPS